MQQEGQGQQRVLHAAAVCMCVSHCPVGPLLSVQGLLWFIAVSHVRAVCFRGGLVGVERMTRGRGVVWGSARTCVCVSVHHAHSQCTACGVLCVCTHVPACLSVVTVTVCMHRVRVSHCSRTGQLSCHSRDCCRGVRAAAGRWLSGWLALCVTHGGVV